MEKPLGNIPHMMTKEEFIEMIEEAIPDDRQITAYTIATIFENNCMYESVDPGNEYFRMLGILDDQKYNLMSDLREENKQRLNVMAEQKKD